MAISSVLQGILDSVSAQPVTGGTPRPAQVVEAQLTPPLTNLSVTDVLTGDLDLTFVAKQVVFKSADLEPSFLPADLDSATLRGQQATGVGTTGTLVPLPDVPGMLGQLKGKMPLSTATSLPVSASVTWQVLDENKKPLPADQFAAPGGLNATRISVAFVPEFYDSREPAAPVARKRYLKATVSLSAGGTSVGPKPLPELEVPVPAVPVPTVLALFLHTNFAAVSGSDDGAVLVVVPQGSPVGSAEALTEVLQQLESLGSSLKAISSLAGLALGTSMLRNALAQPHVAFRAQDSIANLNDIDLIQRGFFENDTEAEDELSSLILLGVTGAEVRCFNSRDFSTGEGDLTVKTGSSLMALVRDLHSISPSCELGTLTVGTVPPGGLFQASDFGDALSSLQFL